ncbi:lysis regulatory protein-like protein [uncultured phage cr125_1]|uniref:Lysis regulatory protein-like protein n=1 Tax=uncultured phage cr125_1 TaxID=2772091 RepID=A0A7M1RTF0_9CAUD|nr:lysis regulatory protein-like protein [uncultured phage cr125_1]QOR57546.1 lysis regulatory protein-like protein [uncultured phage cr125_1]
MKNYQMIPIIVKIINWFSNNIKIVAVGFVSLLIATILFLNNLLSKKNKEIDRITNNIKAYESIATDKEAHNRVLQLTINELNYSKDSLVQYINLVKKENKVKDKNLTNVSVINTEIKDSVKTVIKEKLIDFDKELKLNDLTTIIVSRKDSILTAKIDIKNLLTIFVTENKEYKNTYKNWLVRFFHFDFKKIHIKNYQIVNSNPLIKVTDTRVIEIPDK